MAGGSEVMNERREYSRLMTSKLRDEWMHDEWLAEQNHQEDWDAFPYSVVWQEARDKDVSSDD
jgi:hypothetical protein